MHQGLHGIAQTFSTPRHRTGRPERVSAVPAPGTGKSCVCDSGGSGAEQPARSSALTPAPSQASLQPQGGVLSSARGVPSEHSCPSPRVWGTALSSGIRRRRRRGSGARVGSPRPAAGSADTQRRHTVPFTRPGTRGKELCPAGRPRSS